MADQFIGLDLETSGTDRSVHSVIQVGATFGTEDSYMMYVSWSKDDLVWDEESAAVHKIPREAVTYDSGVEYGQDADETDAQLLEWLTAHDAKRNALHAVGWNVGSFDLPFLKNDLPLSGDLFSYRTVDLNSLCFSIAEELKLMHRGGGNPIGFDGLKKQSKKYAEEVLGTRGWHNALFDAKAALLSWHWLRAQFREVVLR